MEPLAGDSRVQSDVEIDIDIDIDINPKSLEVDRLLVSLFISRTIEFSPPVSATITTPIDSTRHDQKNMTTTILITGANRGEYFPF